LLCDNVISTGVPVGYFYWDVFTNALLFIQPAFVYGLLHT